MAVFIKISEIFILSNSNDKDLAPEYKKPIVARFKKDRRAALRNAKIRLSNIKLDEFVQVMRNKSKWIKH